MSHDCFLNVRYLTTGLTLISVLACSPVKHHDDATADLRADSSPNTDIQTISVEGKSNIEFGSHGVNFSNCILSDVKPSTSTGQRNAFNAKADCTKAIAASFGKPLINQYIEPEAFFIKDSTGRIAQVANRHWCGSFEATFAVKKTAWDSPNFAGIGFYGYETTINAAESTRRVWYSANDVRSAISGNSYLKDGQEVVLFTFIGAGPCSISGSGSNPSKEMKFKPFVSYTGGIERWEIVSKDHSYSFQKNWSRARDLLR